MPTLQLFTLQSIFNQKLNMKDIKNAKQQGLGLVERESTE